MDWREEVLDPGDSGRTLKVARPQLQGVAFLWGQDHQAPREGWRKSETFRLRASCPATPHLHGVQPRYLRLEQVQTKAQESGWPCTAPWRQQSS